MEVPAVTKQLLEAKRAKGPSFAELGKILGHDEVWIAALIYGQARTALTCSKESYFRTRGFLPNCLSLAAGSSESFLLESGIRTNDIGFFSSCNNSQRVAQPMRRLMTVRMWTLLLGASFRPLIHCSTGNGLATSAMA
jgi:hypothetical protein